MFATLGSLVFHFVIGPFAGVAMDGHEKFASRSALLGPSTKRRMTGNANTKEMSKANGAKERSRKSPRAILMAALSGNAAPHFPHFGLRVMEYAGSRLTALQELQRTSRLFISGGPDDRTARSEQTDGDCLFRNLGHFRVASRSQYSNRRPAYPSLGTGIGSFSSPSPRRRRGAHRRVRESDLLGKRHGPQY